MRLRYFYRDGHGVYRKGLVSSKRVSSDGLAETEGEDNGLGRGHPGDGVLVTAVLGHFEAGLGAHQSGVLGGCVV